MYVNNVVLVGNLTCDPCLSENESVKASFRIAASRWRKPCWFTTGSTRLCCRVAFCGAF